MMLIRALKSRLKSRLKSAAQSMLWRFGLRLVRAAAQAKAVGLVPRLRTAEQMAEIMRINRKSWMRLHERHEHALLRAGAYVNLSRVIDSPSLRWDLDKTLAVLKSASN